MVQRKELVDYLQCFLNVDDFKDYCPNGLQVEGCSEINHIVAGVTASQALIDQAVEQNADAILVHHGYFWRGESEPVVGIKQKRIKTLLQADINLLAYHLPLDAHPQLGNNAQLARQLGIEDAVSRKHNGVNDLLWEASLKQSMNAVELGQLLQLRLGRSALWLPSTSNQRIKRLVWCSGGAQSYIEMAAAMGADAYISGEVSEQTTHLAKELDIHYFAAGHHATERYGVQALAAHLAEKFDISYQFIDIENPV